MGFWKTLGLAAGAAVVGVGAVAAAPITGGGSLFGAASLAASLAGAGGIAAAAGTGAAVAGGVAGKMMSDKEEANIENAKKEGAAKVEVKYKKKVEKLVKNLQEVTKKLNSEKQYFNYLIAMVAVGMATARADGEVTQDEIDDLEDFVAGINKSQLPEAVKNIITNLKENPPTFNTAMAYINRISGDINYKLFETVIELVAASDGYVSKEEEALLVAFRKNVA